MSSLKSPFLSVDPFNVDRRLPDKAYLISAAFGASEELSSFPIYISYVTIVIQQYSHRVKAIEVETRTKEPIVMHLLVHG